MSGGFFTAQTAGFSHSFNRLVFPQTNTLTASSVTGTFDAITGTAGVDTVAGNVTFTDAGVVGGSFEAADTINGGEGADTLSLTVTAETGGAFITGALPAALIASVETLQVRSIMTDAGDELTIDMAGLASVTSFVNNLSTSAVTVSNLVATDTVTINGNGSAANGAFTAGYAAAATTSTINVNGDTTGGAVTVTGAGITAQTINSTGGTNVLVSFTGALTTEDYTINAATNIDFGTGIVNVAPATGNTITITGAASRVDLGSNALDTDVDTVDASGLTGGITATIASNTTAVVGGQGDDIINIGTQALGASGTINAGAGNDTLIVTDSTNWASAATRVSGFEVLDLRGTGASYDLGLYNGETSVIVSSAGAMTLTRFVEGTSLRVGNDVANALTVGLTDATGTANALTVTIDDVDTTAAAITVGAITAAGVETLNIVTGDALTTGTSHVVSALTGSTAVTSVVFTGTSDLTISDATVPTGTLVIDGTGTAARLTVGAAGTSGINAGDTVRSGAGNDNVFVNSAVLGNTTTFALGAGDDTITVIGNGSDVIDADFARMTGVENLTLTSATNTTVTLGGFAQTAIASVTGNLDITATALTTGGTIDAGALLTQGVDVVVTNTVDAALDATATLAVTGSAVNDTITVTQNSAADTGDDLTVTNINGGDGIDIITYALTAGGAGADVLTITSTATSAANADIITGFASGTDFFDFNGLGANANGDATDDVANATFAGGIAATPAAGTFIIEDNIVDAGANLSGTTMSALLASGASNLVANFAAFEAQLVATGGIFASTIAGLDAALTAGQTALISVDNGVGSVLMMFTNSSATGNTVTAAELELVAVFTDTVTLAAGDVI